MFRAVKAVVVVVVCYAVVEHLPDVARFLRMRELSRDDYQPRT